MRSHGVSSNEELSSAETVLDRRRGRLLGFRRHAMQQPYGFWPLRPAICTPSPISSAWEHWSFLGNTDSVQDMLEGIGRRTISPPPCVDQALLRGRVWTGSPRERGSIGVLNPVLSGPQAYDRHAWSGNGIPSRQKSDEDGCRVLHVLEVSTLNGQRPSCNLQQSLKGSAKARGKNPAWAGIRCS